MKKVAFLFPGQGSQKVGMGKKLHNQFAIARETFEEANEALGFDLRSLCFEGDADELTKTENAQPAILTASIAAYRVFMQEVGVKPTYLAGHSLGEFSALAAAGSIPFADAVTIVRQRGLFMQEAVGLGEGAMAAIGDADEAEIAAVCAQVSTDACSVVISNLNSPEQTVISGHKQAVDAAGQLLTERGARVTPLRVSAPFHSPLMRTAGQKLNEELLRYSFSDNKWSVISNVTATPYTQASDIVPLLTEQMTSAVQWVNTMQFLQASGITHVIELGPQNVLRNLSRKNIPQIKAFAYDNAEDAVAVQKLFVKRPSGTIMTRAMAIAVSTKNYNHNQEEYQTGVVEPYRAIQKLQEELEANEQQPTQEQMEQAIEMLRTVFRTKGTPLKEQQERFAQLFEETGTAHLFPDFKLASEVMA